MTAQTHLQKIYSALSLSALADVPCILSVSDCKYLCELIEYASKLHKEAKITNEIKLQKELEEGEYNGS